MQKSNFRRAATQKQILAEFYEEIGAKLKARSVYAEAAQLYEDDRAYALANKLNIKAAELAAMESDYLDATRRFEHVARQSMSSNLMKFSVTKYLLQAGTCHLAMDVIGAKRALESYRELDHEFSSTGEYRFLASLSEMVEQGDPDAFGGQVDRFFELKTRPEPWLRNIYEK